MHFQLGLACEGRLGVMGKDWAGVGVADWYADNMEVQGLYRSMR